MPTGLGKRTAWKARSKRTSKRKTTSVAQMTRFLGRFKIYPFERYVSIGPEYTNSNFTITNGANSTLVPVNVTSGMLQLTTNGGAMVPTYSSFGYQFSLLAIPGLTDFTTLFDSYRIKRVKITISPYSNSSGTTVSGAPNFSSDASGFIHYAIDNDSVTNPAASESGIQELQQRAGYKVKRIVGNKPLTISFKPRYAQSAYVSGVSTGYTQGNPKSWIDLSYSTLPHYGLIGVFEAYTPNATSAILAMRVETKYTLEFRTPR